MAGRSSAGPPLSHPVEIDMHHCENAASPVKGHAERAELSISISMSISMSISISISVSISISNSFGPDKNNYPDKPGPRVPTIPDLGESVDGRCRGVVGGMGDPVRACVPRRS